MKFTQGTKLTIIDISSFMATTTKRVVEITGEIDSRVTFKEPGKRKQYFLPNFTDSTLVFEGADIPLKIDSEITTQGEHFAVTKYRGNACLNLVGPIETIREYIQTKNLNEKFARFDVVIQIEGEKEIPVFLNCPTQHAIVERIRAQV